MDSNELQTDIMAILRSHLEGRSFDDLVTDIQARHGGDSEPPADDVKAAIDGMIAGEQLEIASVWPGPPAVEYFRLKA